MRNTLFFGYYIVTSFFFAIVSFFFRLYVSGELSSLEIAVSDDKLSRVVKVSKTESKRNISLAVTA